MGHVPPGPVPAAGAGADLPGRQHRGAGALRPALSGRLVGRLGERFAESFLRARGAIVVAKNLRRRGGEIDLLVRWGDVVVAVEVKTRVEGDPIEGWTERKAAVVRRSSAGIPGLRRIDLIAVELRRDGARVRWVPGAG